MGIITSTATYVRQEQTEYKRAVSENILSIIGGSINYCLDQVGIYAWAVDTFTSSGTWNCPAGVNRVFIYGCGGGAGGTSYTNRHGGGASIPHLVNLAVTPSTAYSITIGAGGVGATSTGGLATDGGFTSFSSLYKYKGGLCATSYERGSFYSTRGVTGANGLDFSFYTGGIQGSGGATTPGGGDASLGNGGNGAVDGVTIAGNGSGYGSGGGGGNNGFGAPFSDGGAGAPGVLYVIYLTNL